jgi:hypothetical protein
MVLMPPGMVTPQPMVLQTPAPQMMQAPPGILQPPSGLVHGTSGMGLTTGLIQPAPAQPPAESGDDRLKKSIAQLTKFFE